MEQKNTIMRNASFLMIAAMVSKIIGILYKSPLSTIVGGEGMGYVSLAQNAYMILLMIASFSIPQAVSKLISERIAFRDYRNAQRIFKGSMLYAVIVGGAVAMICLFGAQLIIPGNQPNAVLALQMLAPTIFLSGILGVYRGYFQAYRNMMPTSISQILEQVFHAVVSILAAWLLIKYVAGDSESSIAKWGAAGSTIGTGAGVVVALLFMLLVYGLNRKGIRARVKSDTIHEEQPYRDIFRVIVMIISPIILSAFIYNVNAYINGVFFSNLMGYRGADPQEIIIMYAEYASYFMMIINIPLTLSSAAPTSMLPEVSALYAQRNIPETISRINQTVRLSMFVSAPCAVGLAVLAHPIVSLLFPITNGTAGYLMILGSFTIFLNGMSNISNAVLQGIGKPKIPMMTTAIALVVDIIVVVLLLLFTDLGIYSLLVAMIVYAVIVCVLNDRFMKKYLDYRNPWAEGYLQPLLASVPMGIVAWAVYHGLHLLIASNLLCLAVSIPLAAITYVIGYIFVAKVPQEQIRRFPCGGIMVKVGRLLRIYQ